MIFIVINNKHHQSLIQTNSIKNNFSFYEQKEKLGKQTHQFQRLLVSKKHNCYNHIAYVTINK